MKIAFTHNLRMHDGPEEAEFDSKETVMAITDALSALGHQVDPIDVSGAVTSVISRLETFKPDLIFNTAEGKHGRFREALYPSLFEELRMPFVGSDAYACTLTLDKALSKAKVEMLGVRTPSWRFVRSVLELDTLPLSFPLIVKPNFEGSSKGITVDSIVTDAESLRARVAHLLEEYPFGLLIEEFIVGRDLVVPFIDGVGKNGVLSPIAYHFDHKVVGNRPFQIYDYLLKNDLSNAVSVELAQLEPKQKRTLQAATYAICRALDIRDFGRLDFRQSDTNGEIYFLEANALPSLEPGAGLYLSAAEAGLSSIKDVLGAILKSAIKRHPAPEAEDKRRLSVGVTYNLKRITPDMSGAKDDEAEFDSPATVQALVDAIATLDVDVVRLEANADLPQKLKQQPVDVVFNVAEGIKGRARESQVPALLDLMGIEYTGSDASTMALTLDKMLAKKIVQAEGILTPKFVQFNSGKERVPLSLNYPLILKPAQEGSSKGVYQASVVQSEAELRERAKMFIDKYKQPVLVEEYIEGREFTVGMIGERRPKILPIMEIVFLNREVKNPVYSFEYKQDFHKDVRFDIPADLSEKMRNALEKAARKCFSALGCRDVARMDFRMNKQGHIYFLECNPIPGMTPNWSDLCQMANGAGYTYDGMIKEILSFAIRRHRQGRD